MPRVGKKIYPYTSKGKAAAKKAKKKLGVANPVKKKTTKKKTTAYGMGSRGAGRGRGVR